MGTSEYIFQTATQGKDHPHAYGDKRPLLSVARQADGSSPRVWGQAENKSTIGACCRIIPTRMGTRQNYHTDFTQGRDHPHAYGDKITRLLSSYLCLGSSPRVWGQGVFCAFILTSIRIIPTRMGTRTGVGVIRAERRDHPHAYGDKFIFLTLGNIHPGSSPRVWGQEYDSFKSLNRQGIIPTRMGTRTLCQNMPCY